MCGNSMDGEQLSIGVYASKRQHRNNGVIAINNAPAGGNNSRSEHLWRTRLSALAKRHRKAIA